MCGFIFFRWLAMPLNWPLNSVALISYSLSPLERAFFFELWGVLKWFLHWLFVVFQNIFNPQGMCFNVLRFVSRKDTSVSSAVRRPKQFALYTFSNKLSLRESCSVPKIFPQWNTVLMSGDSSSHEDQTISVWEIWISHFPFDKSVCCAMCLKYEVISVKFLFLI